MSSNAVEPSVNLALAWQAIGASHVAVYGTLRAGGVNDIVRLQPGIAPLGQTLLRGTLYDLGWYPGLCLSGDQTVLAEVYPMDDRLEQLLDGIEGLWPRDMGEYTKQVLRLPVNIPGGHVQHLEVLVYEAVPAAVANCPRIEVSGNPTEPIDWLAWQTEQGREHPGGSFALRTAF